VAVQRNSKHIINVRAVTNSNVHILSTTIFIKFISSFDGILMKFFPDAENLFVYILTLTLENGFYLALKVERATTA